MTIFIGAYGVFSSRRLEPAVAGVYVCLGMLGLAVAVFVFALMNACWVCL